MKSQPVSHTGNQKCVHPARAQGRDPAVTSMRRGLREGAEHSYGVGSWVCPRTPSWSSIYKQLRTTVAQARVAFGGSGESGSTYIKDKTSQDC